MPPRDRRRDSPAGQRQAYRPPDWLPSAVLDPLVSPRPLVLGRAPFPLMGIAVGLAVLAVAQLAVHPEPPGTATGEVLIPLVGSVAVFYAAWWTTTVERGPQKHAVAVLVTPVFMAIAMGTVGLILLTQLPRPAAFDWPFAVSTTLTIGAVVGVPTGFVLDEVAARQEALEAEYRQSERLNQRLQVVTRVMRHNIRNELTVALGGIDFAASDLASPAARSWVDRSREALERLLDHTEKVIKLESLEQSKADRTTVDVVSYVRGYLQSRALATDGTRLETDLPDRAAVSAHPLIGTAIAEVIENAVVHNDGDDLIVEVDIVAADRWVEIAVADTGEGIPPMELAVLRCGEEDPLDHSQGVGLWLVKWVTEASGGEVSFEENEPCGTVVRLRLPRAE
ncbi:MAG: sensor histidine kinase [Halobacteriales archaeon]